MTATTVKTPKTVKYTPEMTAYMIADYTAGGSVAAIALNVGKSVRSVIAKLSREKVYKAKEYVSKTGAKPIKKDTLADTIGIHLNFTEAETTSLTGANKTALMKLWDAINKD